MTEKTKREGLTQREGAFLMVGVIMSLFASIMANYLTMFSAEYALKNPEWGSFMFFLIVLAFSGLLWCLMKAVDIEMGRLLSIIFMVVIFFIPLSFYWHVKSLSQETMHTGGVSIQTTVIKPAN